MLTCMIMMWNIPGLQDYEAALKLDPKNEQLITDSEKIRHIIQTETVSWWQNNENVPGITFDKIGRQI